MKKMMIYLLATGFSVWAAAPADAGDAGRHRHRTKEEKREARAERKEARAEKREEKRTGMTMNMNTGNPMPVNSYNTMVFPQAATPVMEDYIPSDVLSALKNTYGADLYDVTSMKCNNGDDCYTVRVIKNGAVQTMIVNTEGKTVVQ